MSGENILTLRDDLPRSHRHEIMTRVDELPPGADTFMLDDDALVPDADIFTSRGNAFLPAARRNLVARRCISLGETS
jgi:hypothetical protein